MYQPPHFREDRLEKMHELMQAYPFATLIYSDGKRAIANHVPLILHADLSPLGTLRGHIAKANPLWDSGRENADLLVIFQGPNAYITPSWYASKKEHGKVVPTWNYAVVHAYAALSFHTDVDWLNQHLNRLTDGQEQHRPVPWSVQDAPEAFIASHRKGIVGIELQIQELEGKWKVSQNREARDRLGVERGLKLEASDHASAVSEFVRDYS